MRTAGSRIPSKVEVASPHLFQRGWTWPSSPLLQWRWQCPISSKEGGRGHSHLFSHEGCNSPSLPKEGEFGHPHLFCNGGCNSPSLPKEVDLVILPSSKLEVATPHLFQRGWTLPSAPLLKWMWQLSISSKEVGLCHLHLF